LNDAAALARNPLAIFNWAGSPGKGEFILSDNRAVISSIMANKIGYLFLHQGEIFSNT
jgi:hypothetical protein